MLGGILLGRRREQVEAAGRALTEALRVGRRRTRAALGLGLQAPRSGTHAVSSAEALGCPAGGSGLASALSDPETGSGSHSAPCRVPLCPHGQRDAPRLLPGHPEPLRPLRCAAWGKEVATRKP